MIKSGSNSFFLPTAYWGNIYYYSFIYFYNCQILVDENYQKKSCRNRCKILSPNGVMSLSVPLSKGKNNQTSIQDVTIYQSDPWKSNHLKTIKTAYNSAPYYEYYIQEIETLYEKKKYLTELNNAITQWVIFRFLDQQPIPIARKKHTDFISLTSYDFLNTYSIRHQYHQVFEYKFNFQHNLSILDLIFNLGPELRMFLQKNGLIK